MKESINVLWFKRDLRLSDHQPLSNVLKESEKTLALYIFEPIIENNYDFDIKHWQFVYQSLIEIKKSISVHLFYGNAQDVFNDIQRVYSIKSVFSHEESGVDITFKRDLNLKMYFSNQNIKWREYQSNGVIRGLRNRKSWETRWHSFMQTPIDLIKINEEKFIEKFSSKLLLTSELEERVSAALPIEAGESKADERLNEFLNDKVDEYFKNISYPEASRYHCSLLSAHISWGNISIRQIYQSCLAKRVEIKNKRSLDQYMARIKWHCHFIQKFEMECDMEFENLNPAFNSIRQKKNKKLIQAWKSGQTGYPLIDAAMRCVEETGYLNFRMRACVVSFFTHLLWQPWQEGARHLARCFLDYEPGIHFPQFQMQAGTTGINTVRIYNPVKQSLEKDKKAFFIKRWVPELRNLPESFIHCPWEMTEMEQTMYNFEYGVDYPMRVIDHEKAAKFAKDKIWSIKNAPATKNLSRSILNKHTNPRNRYSRR